MIARLTILTVLCAAASLVRADVELQPIFYAPFEDSPDAVIARGLGASYQARVDEYGPGVVGKAAYSVRRYNGIRFDGRGNIDMDRGTFAFFYKPLYEPNVSAWGSLASVSTDTEGYWAGILQFINKQDVNKQTMFGLHLFDIGRYSPVLKFKPLFQRWKQDEWHHLAVVWDRQEGVTIYEDGQRVDSNWGRFRWDWNSSPRMLVFGEWIYSTRPFAVDEAYAFAECLTDAQIAQLAAGQKATGAPIAITPDAARRADDLARMGWRDGELAQLPAVAAGQTWRYTLARVTHAIDAGRMVAQPFEGLRESCWPLQKYGASTKGQRVALYLAEGQSFDRVRLFAQRPFQGRLNGVLSGVGAEKLLDISADRAIWRGTFDKPREDRVLLLERDFGQVGQIDLYKAESVSALPGKLLAYTTAKLAKLPPTLAGRSALADTPARFDNPVQATEAATPAWTTQSPSFGGLQIITPTLEQATAMDGVVVKLVVEHLKEATPVRIVVKEPVSPERDWLEAEAVLTPGNGARQTFTFHLQGRPVVSHPKSTLAVGKDKIEDPGREVAVLITAANPVTWAMGDGGTSVSLCLADMKTALPIAIEDQTEFAREAYAEINEGHIWDNVAYQGWARLHYPSKWLMHFAPDARPTMELASRFGWRKEPLPFTEPVNDTGAPDWAFWQMHAMRDVRSIVHWIIDNRQVETGEFGGVWGDDTDMTEYWSDYALACDDDNKIKNALRRFWKGLYRDALVEGVSRTIRDNLHSYEEGMGAICHQLLVDYGDPRAVARVMRASSHYDPKWMVKNDDGSYSFRSNYLGYGGVYTEGRFGVDAGVNYLMLYPAAYLTWYNRHPQATPYIQHWKRAPEAPGLVYDAYLRLTTPDDDKRREAYIERILKTEPSRNPDDINAWIDEVGMNPEWRERLEKGARANQWRFFEGNLPTYAGYSPRMTEYFWLAYTATGDLAYLVQSYKQACMFVNNQRWLYTVAQPSTDRIPLPRTSMIRARIGALSVTRGAGGSFWPRHALSYTAGGEQVAALVTTNTDTRLTVRFHNFAKGEHQLDMRVWRLQPGSYQLTLSHDTNADGQPEQVIVQQQIELDRGHPLSVKLPPAQSAVMTLEPIQTSPIDFNLPDPALSLDDVHLEYGDHLHVTVHNVGVKPVENLVVRVSDGWTGAVIGERTIARIDPPLDLMPRTELIEITNANAVSKRSLIIELDPDRKHPDLNRHNNRVEYFY